MSSEVDDGSGGGLSNDAVIGIACGCGLIVIILLSILGVVLFRRRKGQAAKAKDYESDPAHSRPPPSNGSVPHIQKSVGYDNPGRDMVDSYNVRHQGRSYPLSPVHTNSIPNGYYGSPQKANMSPRGTNGSVPLDKSYDSNQDRERFENSRNLRNQNLSGTGDPYGYGRKRGDLEFHSVPASPRKDQFIDLQDSFVKEDEPSGNESGYSTPDAVKPRKTKVFHEVVV